MAVNVLYDDPVLNYEGRWTDYGSSMGSGWWGSRINFKVSGTLNLSINIEVLDTSATLDYSWVYITIDDGDILSYQPTTIPEIYTGSKTATFSIPDTGEHNISVLVVSHYTRQFDESGHNRITSIDIDTGGSFSVWNKTTGITLGIVGDSWMSSDFNWTYLMDSAKYWLYPIATPAVDSSELDAQIDYDYTTVLNTDDPVLDAILINSSVNDHIAGISLSAFNTSFASVVDKLRAQQPDALIMLLQSPRNVGDGLDYDKYGPEMASIASTRDRVEYIEVPSSLWPSLTWAGGQAHLDYASRIIFADFVEAEIDKLIPFTNRSQGYIIY